MAIDNVCESAKRGKAANIALALMVLCAASDRVLVAFARNAVVSSTSIVTGREKTGASGEISVAQLPDSHRTTSIGEIYI